jgi:hypothetical protein
MTIPARLAAVTAAAIILAACSSAPAPTQIASCKAAMSSALSHGMAHPGAPASPEPESCKGLGKATLKRLLGEVTARALKQAIKKALSGTPLPSPPAQPALTPQEASCKRELSASLAKYMADPDPPGPPITALRACIPVRPAVYNRLIKQVIAQYQAG